MKENLDIIFFCAAIGFMVFTADKIFSIGEPAVSYFIDGVCTTTCLFAAGFNLSKHL